jgi:hypothetical protein
MENNKTKIIGNFIIIRSPSNIRINYTRKTATIRPTRTAKRVEFLLKKTTLNVVFFIGISNKLRCFFCSVEYKIRIDVLPTKSKDPCNTVWSSVLWPPRYSLLNMVLCRSLCNLERRASWILARYYFVDDYSRILFASQFNHSFTLLSFSLHLSTNKK